MLYLNKIEDDWKRGNITRDELVELRKAYENATPEEKRAMERKQANSKAKESNPKTSEQKTLEAIRSNTSTIVNIMVFYLVLSLIYIIYMLIQMSKYY
jgi:replication initiation and membrane attachment protein DnaB